MDRSMNKRACGVCVSRPAWRNNAAVVVAKSVDCCGRPPSWVVWKRCLVCCMIWERKMEWILLAMLLPRKMERNEVGRGKSEPCL